MCNRYTLYDRETALAVVGDCLREGLEPPDWIWNPRYNLAPGDLLPLIRRQIESGPFKVERMAWGILLFYEREKKRPTILTILKREKIRKLAAFKMNLAERRCL